MSNIDIVIMEDIPLIKRKPLSWRVSLPANVAVKRLVKRLITRLELDTLHPGAYRFVYKLAFELEQKLIGDNNTLSEEGVVQNDVLKLIRGFGDGDSVQGAIAATRSIMVRARHFLPPLCSRDRVRIAAPYNKIICCPVCRRPYHYYCWRDNGNSCSHAGCKGSGRLKSVKISDALADIINLLKIQDNYLDFLYLSDDVKESERRLLKNLFYESTDISTNIYKLIDEFQD